MSRPHDLEGELTAEAGPKDSGERALWLIAFLPGGEVVTTPLPARGRLTVGRAEGAELRIDHASISRQHAVFHVVQEGSEVRIEVEDLGSSNGTLVSGQRLAPGHRAPVMPGEAIDLGSVIAMVQRSPSRARPRRLLDGPDFETRLEEEIERARRSGGSFGLLRIVPTGLRPEAAAREILARIKPFDVVSLANDGALELLLLDATKDELEGTKIALWSRFVALGVKAESKSARFPDEGRRARDLLDKVRSGAQSSRADEPRSKPARGIAPEQELTTAIVADPAMVGLYRLAERVASSDLSVLLLGETGTGKEVLAEAIHTKSPRAPHPFVRLHCAALAESVIESELFGHEKGAFTGAERPKPGLLETANGGTVLLDEIGELPMSIQVKLLRVLERREIMRVGAVRPAHVDVRFVSATNRNLHEEIERGRFRQDLYYRLNGVTLSIPPLRDRPLDLVPLTLELARRAHRRMGYEGEPNVTDEALAWIRGYTWPGNVRELVHVLERAALFAGGGPIEASHLPVSRMSAPGLVQPEDPGEDEDRRRVLEVLEQCGGNRTRAAKILGMARNTLAARLDAYGVARSRPRD
ncbi:MAG: sigma 54-interacting transcriptional regulator [Deltaproteobacteria bacterium]|nr:sigma 54-interacting transcriptional regulator [Deltaproteobacteria bacterium]